eukprot:CAMPEP_0171086334 /NCGR_PEP_ID=MMETSP0766_2-20121228/19481_1 /TAXON_ID=439317 /ORGANISM="Gambierdiscus australes, Strain CAWD 149" /LENGTH=64 /DNA_ID=CAMNT_0011543973 /DNA_START=123 /DNA_END=313 /DNA_ORIENTATION=+
MRLLPGDRVKGVSFFNSTPSMYIHLGLALLWLQQAVSTRGPYEYFSVWRFDVAMDVPFSSLVRT